MENKKTLFTILGIGLAMCFVLISIIIVLIDSQQSTIQYQNSVINERDQTIQDQSESLNKFENDAEYKRVKEEIERANKLLLSQQDQIYDNLNEIEQLQASIKDLDEIISRKDEIITQQQQTIDEQSEILFQKENDINDLNDKIDTQTQTLNEHQKVVDSYKQSLINLTHNIEELKQNLAQKTALLSEKDEQLTSKSQNIAELEQKVASMQQKIAEQTLIIEADGMGTSLGDTALIELLKKKQQQIDEQNELIEKQKETITSQTSLIEEYKNKQTEIDEIITKKDQLINDQAILLQEKEDAILAQQQIVDDLNQRIQQLENQIAEQQQTISSQQEQIENNATSFCVSFIAEGELVNKQYIKRGEKVATIPAIPEKEGYDGVWSDFDTIVDNTVIYAIYSPKKYKITYNLDLFEYYSFKNAYFYLNGQTYIIDFWKNTLNYDKTVAIVDNKFTLNGLEYTIDIEKNVVYFGDVEFAIEDNAFMMDNIYYIKDNAISYNTTISINGNQFALDNENYTIDTINHKIVSNEIQIDIDCYYCQPLNYLVYPSKNELKSKTQNSKSYQIVNNQITIGDKKYKVDYQNRRLCCFLGASSLKSAASELPIEFSYGDKLIKLPKNVAQYVKNISFDGKQTSDTATTGYNKPVGWELNAIKCSPTYDDEWLYFVPINYTDLTVYVVWGS
ncbi:MAG: hypothetical protein IKQ31_01830 [Clostridia bacterium]|nr:hypothetical protein [Clostridia bacterium]